MSFRAASTLTAFLALAFSALNCNSLLGIKERPLNEDAGSAGADETGGNNSAGQGGHGGATSKAGNTSAGGGEPVAGDAGEGGNPSTVGGSANAAGTTSVGGTTSTAGSSNAAGSSNTAGSTSTGGKTGTAGSTGTAGTGGGATASCSTGKLLEGDPLYDASGTPNPAGQDLLADPPVRNEAVAVIGSNFFVETEQEIWRADMSAATPKLVRLAGMQGSVFINAGGTCATTTFLTVRDMTATPQGTLVLIDYVGGAVLEIMSPNTDACTSNWVAGTHVKTHDPGSNYPLAYGDKDGAGASALFGGSTIQGAGIHKVAADPDGNIYTWDEGTAKFKKIGKDVDRTVSTIGVSSTDDNVMGLTFLNGKLYATGVDGENDFLLEVDPASYNVATPKANVKTVYRSASHFPDVGAGQQAITSQVINDGQALIISSQTGFVWRVATDGTVLTRLAGSGEFIDYGPGFSPLVPHAATDWQLVTAASNAAGGPWLALADNKLYWAGGIGTSQYALQFSCP